MTLETAVELWREDVANSILYLANQKRKDNGLQPWPKSAVVWITEGPKANLQLFNLKVWRERYCVSLTFILETLFGFFLRNEKYNPDAEPSLKVPLMHLTGQKARKILEADIARAYPGRENYTIANQPLPNLPLDYVEYSSARDFVSQYRRRMVARHTEKQDPQYKRKFRKRGVSI